MKIDELLVGYFEKKTRQRQIGRYWASEVNSIIKGYLKPEDFFKERVLDPEGASNIHSGIAFEAHFHTILGDRHEKDVKKIIKLGDIELVVVPDFLFEDMLIETKFPVKPLDEIPERYKYQLECEYRAFNLPTYLGVFSHPFNVVFHPYKPSARRWQTIQDKLKEFHDELSNM